MENKLQLVKWLSLSCGGCMQFIPTTSVIIQMGDCYLVDKLIIFLLKVTVR